MDTVVLEIKAKVGNFGVKVSIDSTEWKLDVIQFQNISSFVGRKKIICKKC